MNLALSSGRRSKYAQKRVARAPLHQADHLDRLRMMHGHVLHELHVRAGDGADGGADGRFGKRGGRLSGCAG